MAEELKQRCSDLIAELGLGSRGDVLSVRPLTGGVASDIALVDLPNRSICVKFALPKLRVVADWHAPVHRNAAEFAWLKFVAELAPECAVRVLGRSEAQHGFAMEFVSGDGVYLWKSALLEGAEDHEEAQKVGRLLGRVHAASATGEFDRSAFENRDDFLALRIEPYLAFTAVRHPKLSSKITQMADALYSRQSVLIHGDASPKNILFRDGHPILLDAECASMGDPAFDPAFCLNHLLLKAVHFPETRDRLLGGVEEFWRSYLPFVTWEEPNEIEARVSALLPMLFLARVDGKSPVEYLNTHEQELVREIAVPLIQSPPATISALIETVAADLKDHTE